MQRFTLVLAAAALLAVGAPSALGASPPPPSSPTVSTGAVSSTTDTTAVVTGTVTPNGAATTYLFEYGTSPSLGTQGSSANAGSGTTPVSVKSTLAGLTPGTTYYYRLDASNGDGSAAGAIRSLKTTGSLPPVATTGGVTGLTINAATLTGTIVPQADATTYYFRYGLTTAYGLQTTPAALPAGSAAVTVTAAIPGLDPGTTFHYQLVALHGSEATVYGQDAMFTTYPWPRPAPGLAASTTPRRSHTAPYVFLTTGHLVPPATTPDSLACTGSAEVIFMLGRRTLAKTTAALTSTCTFSGGVTIDHLPIHAAKPGGKQESLKLTVIVRFSGNTFVAPAHARRQTITVT